MNLVFMAFLSIALLVIKLEGMAFKVKGSVVSIMDGSVLKYHLLGGKIALLIHRATRTSHSSGKRLSELPINKGEQPAIP